MSQMHLTVSEASKWASNYLRREVTTSNILYLVNYGRLPRKVAANGAVLVDIRDLSTYYDSQKNKRELYFRQQLGDDLNWYLSFEQYKEAETTKHVHRLHPYKGKFIPQLVEYFLDSHTDEFKTDVIFNAGDVVIDPFCGSGTTLVQANELGIHAIGVDISYFNTLISNMKLCNFNLLDIQEAASEVQRRITNEPLGITARAFDTVIMKELKRFNDAHFPASSYKYAVRIGKIHEMQYGAEKEEEFLTIYRKRLREYGLSHIKPTGGGFLDTWYFLSARREIDAAYQYIQSIADQSLREVLCLILSRTIRSSRATTHYNLATLREPTVESYYCAKHGKICKPLVSILRWWNRYTSDTITRLSKFASLRTDTQQMCITGDGRSVNIPKALAKHNPFLSNAVKNRNVRGIFSSPPYVGLINYHEQHAYAYELFQLERNDSNEIGILEKGIGKAAQNAYVLGVVAVLRNCRRYLMNEFDIFLVANDRYNLYPKIATHAGLRIVKEYKRPVINRAEGIKGAYGESIFHLKRI